MKKITSGLIILAFSISGFFGFISASDATISGTIKPAENAVSVNAISGVDTFTSNIINGSFEIVTAKSGTYNLVIHASAPYKTTVKEGIIVSEDQTVDVGEIQLEKE